MRRSVMVLYGGREKNKKKTSAKSWMSVCAWCAELSVENKLCECELFDLNTNNEVAE